MAALLGTSLEQSDDGESLIMIEEGQAPADQEDRSAVRSNDDEDPSPRSEFVGRPDAEQGKPKNRGTQDMRSADRDPNCGKKQQSKRHYE